MTPNEAYEAWRKEHLCPECGGSGDMLVGWTYPGRVAMGVKLRDCDHCKGTGVDPRAEYPLKNVPSIPEPWERSDPCG